ncbi:MAG TPA: FAD-binding oxidoreductase [Desulfomonilaceae bacterium]|nr:FAD-binding oxidoreductase [Desulfomonilaceae bacterium]
MGLKEFLSESKGFAVPITETNFEDYLTDESRFRGYASALVRAREERHVIDLVRLANRYGVRLTVVSGKTSLTGAPIPLGGVVIDIKGLDSISSSDPTVVGPGVIVRHYKEHVDGLGFFYPPDPTSKDSCTIGGNVACNASGALSYLYGPTRDYIQGLKIVLPTGTVLDIKRGDITSAGGAFRIPDGLLTDHGTRDLVVPLPKRTSPEWGVCKNAAGLYSSEPMDLVDLFIGSEGILGIILQVRTKLLPRRRPYFALMLYLPSRELTTNFVTLLDKFKRCFHDGESRLKGEIERILRSIAETGEPRSYESFDKVVPACMEWFGTGVAAFLSPEQSCKLKNHYGSLYIEQEYDRGDDPLETAGQWADLVQLINSGGPAKGRGIEAEVALDEGQIRNWKNERKAVPEKLNEAIRPGLTKIGMDYAVPMKLLDDFLKLYDDMLPRGRSYVFGHIGNAHLHVNILPERDEDAASCRDVSRRIGQEVVKMGGTVSGEHGIGKLKREALEMMIGIDGINEIRRIKKLFDPQQILNIGNMVSMQ